MMSWFSSSDRRHLITGKGRNAEICRYLRNMTLSLQKMTTVSLKPSISVTVKLTDGSVLSGISALCSPLRIMKNTASGAVQVKLREKR